MGEKEGDGENKKPIPGTVKKFESNKRGEGDRAKGGRGRKDFEGKRMGGSCHFTRNERSWKKKPKQKKNNKTTQKSFQGGTLT